jgi:hypothetical protein
MFLVGYRCSGCKRVYRRNQCEPIEGPLGPERICADCGSVVLLAAHRGLIFFYVVVIGALALGYGCWPKSS